MPGFHSRMGDRLRSPEEGADTVVWLCVSESAKKQPSGRFFEGTQLPSLHALLSPSLPPSLPPSLSPDRSLASEHLPLAWSRSSQQDEELLMTKLKEISERFTETSTN